MEYAEVVLLAYCKKNGLIYLKARVFRKKKSFAPFYETRKVNV